MCQRSRKDVRKAAHSPLHPEQSRDRTSLRPAGRLALEQRLARVVAQTSESMRVKLRRVKEGHCEFERLKGRSGCACERWHGWFCFRLGSRERSTTDQTDSPKWWGGTFGVLCAR